MKNLKYRMSIDDLDSLEALQNSGEYDNSVVAIHSPMLKKGAKAMAEDLAEKLNTKMNPSITNCIMQGMVFGVMIGRIYERNVDPATVPGITSLSIDGI